MHLTPKDIVLCHKDDAKYMEEYLRVLAQGVAAIHAWTSTQIPYTDPAVTYVCVRRIPPLSLLPPGACVAFVNTEQLTVPAKLREFLHMLQKAAPVSPSVFDYSAQNVAIAITHGVPSQHIPVGECVAETRKLRGFMLQPKEFDVAIVGTMSPHRKAVADGLRAQGIRVDVITDCWKDERDARIGRCAILLNVHFNHDYKLYEPIRCNRWLYAGMPIVTEPCVDGAPPGVYEQDVCNAAALAALINRLLC